MKYFTKLADKTDWKNNPGGGSFDVMNSREFEISDPSNTNVKNVDADKKTFTDMMKKHQEQMRTSTGDPTWVMPKNEAAFFDSLNTSANLPHITMLTEEQKEKWNKQRQDKTDKGHSHESTAFMTSGTADTDTLYLNPERLLPTYKAEVSHTLDRKRLELNDIEYGNKTSKEWDQFGYDAYDEKSGGASEDVTHNEIEVEVDNRHAAAKARDRGAVILEEKKNNLDAERNIKKEKWLEENKPENKNHKYHPENLNKESKLKYF